MYRLQNLLIEESDKQPPPPAPSPINAYFWCPILKLLLGLKIYSIFSALEASNYEMFQNKQNIKIYI